MQTLDLNETAPISTTWWDANQDPSEPSAITLTLTKPDGTTASVNKAAMTGSTSGGATQDVWTYALVVNLVGVWLIDVTGTVAGLTVTQPQQVLLVGAGETSPGPCTPWCTWEQVLACLSADDQTELDAVAPASRELFIARASMILWNLTDRAFSGRCEATRSITTACSSCGWGATSDGHPCSCGPRARIDLGGFLPVWGAWNVSVDGTILPPTAYRVYDRRWLVRLDGLPWPGCPDLTDPSAFQVSWAFGRDVPIDLALAAAAFVAEDAKRCLGLACQFPQRMVQGVNREGVSFVFLDSMAMLKEGRTGIGIVDETLMAYHKGKIASPGVFSPGRRSRIRRVFTG